MNERDIDFSTYEYVRAHGKQPRGKGNWAFCPAQDYNKPNYLDHVFWAVGTFEQAKKAARKHFAETGDSTLIVVCS